MYIKAVYRLYIVCLPAKKRRYIFLRLCDEGGFDDECVSVMKAGLMMNVFL